MRESFPEPIRILSDLHLGHDACALKDVEVLRPLLEGAGTVIFNGDTAEVRARRLKAKAQEGAEALQRVVSEAGVRETLYLTGNHDPRFSDVHHVDLCGGKLLVTHGDFLFRYVSPWSKKLRHCRPQIDALLEACDRERLEKDFVYRLEITRACCDIMEVSEIRYARNLWGKACYLAEELWPPTRLATILWVWMRSPGLMAAALDGYRPEARAAVFGHIHRAGIWRRRGKLLINTGAFLTMTRSLVVEVRGEALEVYDVERSESSWRLAGGRSFSL